MIREPCDICHATDTMRPYLEVSLLGVLAVWIHQCRKCGFRQIRPRLTRKELDVIYPDEYFDSKAEIGFSDYDRQAQRYERVAYFLAKNIRKLVPSGGRLLDVGCALGFLLQALRRYISLSVHGIEISPFAAYYAQKKYGLDVKCGVLEEADYPSGYFDFVIQKDLLEHVPRPRAHLIESHRILKPHGCLWLTTPNGEANLSPLLYLSRESQNSRKDELPLMGQGHLSFFSKDHLMRLFGECGFEVIYMRNIGIRRGLRHLGILPRKKKSLKTIPRSSIRAPLEPAIDEKQGHSLDLNSKYVELYEQISAEVERRHNPLRSSRPYFYQRQLVQWLDALPAPFTVGLDFEFMLRKS